MIAPDSKTGKVAIVAVDDGGIRPLGLMSMNGFFFCSPDERSMA
jgi:hypothetical protein